MTKAADISQSGGQSEGMIRQNAITDKCDALCASVMIAKPHSSSAVHHHGDQGSKPYPLSSFSTICASFANHRVPFNADTIVYAAKGHGVIISDGGKTRQQLSPGDFALIPAFAEHQEANEGDEEVIWIITRSGRSPIVENLEGWNQS